MKPQEIEKIKLNLAKKLKIGNKMALPQFEKVVISSGLGRAKLEKELFEQVKLDLAIISGQIPLVTKAKKSIASFKLRGGDIVGLKVTLRGKRMYDFLEKLARVVLSSQRDFRGISEKSFDNDNNLNLGFKEQIIFIELRHTHIIKTYGLQVTIRIKSKNKKEAIALLEGFGFPFKEGQ